MQGAKKKKRATKVGFGRDEEEDGEDKSTQPNVVSPAILIDSSSVLDSAHTAVESERLPSAGTNAISAMDVLEKVQVTHDGYSTSEFNLEGMSISENNLSSRFELIVYFGHSNFQVIVRFQHHFHRNFPSTPPPLPPTVAPATVVAAQLHSNVPAITDHPVNIDTRSMSSSQAISDLAPPQISAPTPEPARPSANACVPSPVHTHVAVPASVPSPVAAAVAAETPVQKLERKSKETLVQLTRYLADLSRLHSSALSGQGRFKSGEPASSRCGLFFTICLIIARNELYLVLCSSTRDRY